MTLKLFVIGLAMLASACVSVPELPEQDKKFKLHQGRFSVSYQKEGTAQREQGGFEWKIQTDGAPPSNRPDDVKQDQQTKAMQLALLSPIGNTIAVIALDPAAQTSKRASFTSPNQLEYAPSIDVLMQNLLGWRLPLETLLPWLGTTSPSSLPSDWDIAVRSRHGNNMPKLITADNAILKLSIRLVFEE
jgi:outer membrane biogenesis lipoprotein LolB